MAGDRVKDYEYALKFRREYYDKVMSIADIWNVNLLTEEELPKHRKNVMKCEENTSAFIDLKRRCFFQNMDMTKVQAKERLVSVKKALYMLDKCHKMTWDFMRKNWANQPLNPDD